MEINYWANVYGEKSIECHRLSGEYRVKNYSKKRFRTLEEVTKERDTIHETGLINKNRQYRKPANYKHMEIDLLRDKMVRSTWTSQRQQQGAIDYFELVCRKIELVAIVLTGWAAIWIWERE